MEMINTSKIKQIIKIKIVFMKVNLIKNYKIKKKYKEKGKNQKKVVE